jgi:NitT/TauT family transport system ATP-binding protein
MAGSDLTQVNAGFLPLLDSAILVAAREKGFAEDEHIGLRLIRETSWANIRDRMAVGHFEMAHMLGPMPIAGSLGLTPLSLDVVAPMALGLGGNAVTVSRRLAAAIAADAENTDAAVLSLGAFSAGEHLARIIAQGRVEGLPPLSFAVVHPYSAHNYDLRYWLAASGIDPERDVQIVVVPPPLMADALQSGRIDGFCVGEPWSSVAVQLGAGVILTTKSAIWRSSPEKVLGVSAVFARDYPDILAGLLRGLYRAAEWCGQPENHDELAGLLARPDYIGQDISVMLPALRGRLPLGNGATSDVPDFFLPFDKAATFPWKSHALWFYSQMVRWGHATWSLEYAARAAETYRPDLYRAAIAPLGAPVPSANSKVEGALDTQTSAGASDGSLVLGPDGFFDNKIFDPDLIEGYVLGQKPAL